MDDLLIYSVQSIWQYLGLAIAGSLFVRLFNSTVEGMRARVRLPRVGFKTAWKGVFLGCGYDLEQEEKNQQCGSDQQDKRRGDDYWLPFFIGLFELLAYPILMVNKLPLFIGAWLTFKIVHRMKYDPGIDRGPYNRFLVANAMVLILSYFIARFFLDP